VDEQASHPLCETWDIHNRINLYLLAAIPDDALSASMSARGRTVYGLFAHIHNVRLMWLQGPRFDKTIYVRRRGYCQNW
jgi:uncharacterized damage-inducible protein DinB